MAKSRRNLLIYHLHDTALAAALQAYARGRLIDIGCGTKPYEGMTKGLVTEHVGLDRAHPFDSNAKVDLVGTAYQIPVADASFDTAMSTAALEHLSEPEEALRECFRILKGGGKAIYTVPLLWHVHAPPWDYYRFTNFGLRHVFEKAGFDIIEIKALSGFWVTMAQLFIYYLGRADRFRLIKVLRVVTLLSLPIQAIALLLDRLDKAEDWTWMYLVVARKPAD